MDNAIKKRCGVIKHKEVYAKNFADRAENELFPTKEELLKSL